MITNIRVFEAFAGYGSQAMALKRLQKAFPDTVSFEFVGIAEIEPNAIKAYNAVHVEATNYGDITKINWGGQIPDFDLFTYSFPCQDISNAGLQRGFAAGSGSRSSLLWECCRCIEHKKPKYLLMENVKALVSEKFMKDFSSWAMWLEEQGYRNFWQVINAKDYGVPQNRERVFMVSVMDCTDMYIFPKPFKLEKRLKDVLEKNVDESFYLRQEQVSSIMEHCERKQMEGCGFRTQFKDADDIATTISTRYGNRETDTYLKERNVFGNKRLQSLVDSGKIDGNKTQFLDAYNQSVADDCSGTITTRVADSNGTFISEPTSKNVHQMVECNGQYRIRKLTPRECFRLMDCTEEDIDKIQAAGISKSAQYRLAGNSIVVSCLYHIFRKMFVDRHTDPGQVVQLSLF